MGGPGSGPRKGNVTKDKHGIETASSIMDRILKNRAKYHPDVKARAKYKKLSESHSSIQKKSGGGKSKSKSTLNQAKKGFGRK